MVKKEKPKVAKKTTKKTAKAVTAKKATQKTAKKVTKKTAKKVVTKKTTAKKTAKKATAKQPAPKAEEAVEVAPTQAAPEGEATEGGEESAAAAIQGEIKESVEKIHDEIAEIKESFPTMDIHAVIQALNFFSSESDECLEKNCDNPVTTLGYCRFHYIKNWKEIKAKQQVLQGGKLATLIKDLVDKYPREHVETVLVDLQDDKSFYAALRELNIESDYDALGDEEGGDDDFESREVSHYRSPERGFEDEEV